MAISGDLHARYTSEVDVDWRSAFVISHPNAGVLRIIDHTEAFTGYGNATTNPSLQVYTPVPTQIVLPTRDESGRSEMSLTWCGINGEALAFLNAAAADGTQPIRCLHTVYILSDPHPQIVPFTEFLLTGIGVTEEAVTATASRADIINKAFPTKVYRLDRFPGLRRR